MITGKKKKIEAVAVQNVTFSINNLKIRVQKQ